VYFDPADRAGKRAYVTVWGGRKVVELALASPAAPSVARAVATDKNPQGAAFLDARWMVVALCPRRMRASRSARRARGAAGSRLNWGVNPRLHHPRSIDARDSM
jgi:hypothetical protein